MIRACRQDMIWHFGSSYCHNDEFVIYPSNVIEKHWNKYLWTSVQLLYIEEKQILKRTTLIFSMLTIKSWAWNHSKCIRKMHGFMFRSRICRFHIETDKVLSTDFVRCDINDVTITGTSCIVYWDKHCVLRHYPVVSERGDMDSETTLVILSIGSHSKKLTVSRLITLMGM